LSQRLVPPKSPPKGKQSQNPLRLNKPFIIRTDGKCGLQGFLAPGTDTTPIVPALEKIWADSMGQSMANFNFRLVTSKFNELVYQYPIRIPERFALVIRCISPSCPPPPPWFSYPVGEEM